MTNEMEKSARRPYVAPLCERLEVGAHTLGNGSNVTDATGSNVDQKVAS